MKRLLFAVASLLFAYISYAEDNPLWLRHQAISPDGKKIAFCYCGDIYTVGVEGGIARQITSNESYDGYPVWNKKGDMIAFASNREGSFDVYVVSENGGTPKRLTFSGGNEIPNTFLTDSVVLFNTYTMPDRKFDMFPSSMFQQVYAVGLNAGRPILFSSYPMQNISVGNDGEMLYTDIKGYEDPFRKHEQASVCRDIWLRDPSGKNFKKLTEFKGEDRNAVFAPDGKGFYYLSEKDGTSNIYYRKDVLSGMETKMTAYKKNPVRFLSVANNGTICFGYDGEIYTIGADRTPKKVSVKIFADNKDKDVIYKKLSSGVSNFALSPNEKEVAYTINGDVYVSNIEYGTTKRITNTVGEERYVSFSPDGRSIMYSSERDGFWNIYISKLTDKKDKLFCYSNNIKEEQVTKSNSVPMFRSLFSPDGKQIAFLKNRTEIVGKDLKTGREWTIMPGKYQYSYQDNDQSFSWSPDGKWILTQFFEKGGWNNTDVGVFASDGSGKFVNLTQSGYSEGGAKWVLGGKAILFTSDRAGMRSHGSWGSQDDVYIMFLNAEAEDNFKLSKEEREMQKDDKDSKDDKKKDEKKDKKNKKDKKDSSDSISTPKPILMDFDNRDIRTHRLSFASGSIIDVEMNNDATKLYYIAQYGKDVDLWEVDMDDRSSKRLVKDVSYGQLVKAKDGKTLYLSSYGGIKKIASASDIKSIKISADFEHRPREQRQYIFEHAWQLVKNKFYDPKLHGVDWEYYRDVYKKFLPYINNEIDFADMLSEMLGELNASHTGARCMIPNNAQQTATLGVFFSDEYKGDGLMIDEIIQGSPLDCADKAFKQGMVITAIDGQTIKKGEPYEYMLNGKVGKRVLLSVYDPSKKTTFTKTIKPVSAGTQMQLLLRRWVKQREELVKKWSDGRVGYVYVRAMNSNSFRSAFQELLGKYRNCDAVIVDTRYNGGGWLHDDLVILLTGKESIKYTPRGQYIGSSPFMQWCKPSCVLQSEGNYSNGHGFPWLYKYLKLGKLIGTPVPGTMTAVWWESQINSNIVFGVPQVTCEDMEGNVLENQELEPDILVYNTPEDFTNGYDRQLKTAVDEMLKTIKNKY